MTRYIVLGRFQPFHMGHQYLVKSAFNHVEEGDKLVLAIGSKQAGWEPNNPWTCLLYTSPSPRDQRGSRMPSSA